jgi:hypothetical protein
MLKNGNSFTNHQSTKGNCARVWDTTRNSPRLFAHFKRRTYELLNSLAGTNRSLLSQFGFSPELLENEKLKREKAKELEVDLLS